MKNKMVKVDNLSYRINEKLILDKINLDIERNKFIGVVGPNGSGKTTLLKHFYNAIKPVKNTVYIDSISIENYRQNEIAKNISVMKQENNSEFDYSVIEMVLMGRIPYKNPLEDYNSEDYKIAMDNLKKVGMDLFYDRKYNSLSGGEKQRVLIARSLTQDTEVMILDEPTNHLDIFYQLYLCQIIKKSNKTVVSVFHDLNMAAKYCDFIYVLKEGRIEDSGQPKKVFTREMIARVFNIDGRVEIDSQGQINIRFENIILRGE